MVDQDHRIGWVWKTPFRKIMHTYSYLCRISIVSHCHVALENSVDGKVIVYCDVIQDIVYLHIKYVQFNINRSWPREHMQMS